MRTLENATVYTGKHATVYKNADGASYTVWPHDEYDERTFTSRSAAIQCARRGKFDRSNATPDYSGEPVRTLGGFTHK